MIGGIQIKVCGLSRLVDAAKAGSIGADRLGFIFYPKSPRYLSVDAFRALRQELPSLSKVAVTVTPDRELLETLQDLGFDAFQIHFSPEQTENRIVREWSDYLTPERLWLAPKVNPAVGFDESLVPLASTFLWDTYEKSSFGGTGKVGDWKAYKRVSERYPEKTWVLAGGLNPQNLLEALEATGARSLDLNSGVEESPGVKDPIKLDAVKTVLNSL